MQTEKENRTKSKKVQGYSTAQSVSRDSSTQRERKTSLSSMRDFLFLLKHHSHQNMEMDLIELN